MVTEVVFSKMEEKFGKLNYNSVQLRTIQYDLVHWYTSVEFSNFERQQLLNMDKSLEPGKDLITY